MKVDVPFAFDCDNASTVQLTGSFLDWKERVPLIYNESENSYCVTLSLPPGIHYFKFIVNNEWVASSKYSQVIDLHGNTNNCVNVEIPKRIRKRSSKSTFAPMKY